MKPLNNHGMSLIEMTFVVGFLAASLMASGYLLVQNKTIEVKSSVQADLDRFSLIQLQKAKSSNFIKRILNLNDSSADNIDNVVNTSLKRCLGKRGTSCNQNTTDVPNEWRSLSSEAGIVPCSGKGCSIVSSISYRAVCSSASSCERVELRLSTSASGVSAKARLHTLRVSSYLLVDHPDMEFDCASIGNLKGMDLKNAKAKCFRTSPQNCGSNLLRPINRAENSEQEPRCPGLVNRNCPANQGIRRAGIYEGLCDS